MERLKKTGRWFCCAAINKRRNIVKRNEVGARITALMRTPTSFLFSMLEFARWLRCGLAAFAGYAKSLRHQTRAGAIYAYNDSLDRTPEAIAAYPADLCGGACQFNS